MVQRKTRGDFPRSTFSTSTLGVLFQTRPVRAFKTGPPAYDLITVVSTFPD